MDSATSSTSISLSPTVGSNYTLTTTTITSTAITDGIECGIPSFCTECTSVEPVPCNITICPFSSYCCNDNTECCIDIPDPVPISNLPIILGVSIPIGVIVILIITSLILLYIFNKKFNKTVKKFFGIQEEKSPEFDSPNYEYADSTSTYYTSPGGSENYEGYDVIKGAKKHVYKDPENQFTDISKEKKNF